MDTGAETGQGAGAMQWRGEMGAAGPVSSQEFDGRVFLELDSPASEPRIGAATGHT